MFTATLFDDRMREVFEGDFPTRLQARRAIRNEAKARGFDMTRLSWDMHFWGGR